MESITLEQIATTFAFLVALIGSIGALLKYIKKMIEKVLKPLNDKIDNMEKSHMKKIDSLELSNIKTDLVNFINDIERGVPKSQIQKLNAHELYDRYVDLGGNSYVHDHWQKLLKEGKI